MSAPVQKHVFINYRHADTAVRATMIHEALTQKFGDSIFLDTRDVAPGEQVAHKVNSRLTTARILLVVIGMHWLDSVKKLGNQRLIDRDNDWVRYEIRTALQMGIPVVPVHVDGAEPVEAAWLPEDIRGLIEGGGAGDGPMAGAKFVSLRHSDWDTDLAAFVVALADTYGLEPFVRQPRDSHNAANNSHSTVSVQTGSIQVEFKIDRPFDEYSEEEKNVIVERVRKILEMSSDPDHRTRRGSVVLDFLNLTPQDAERLKWAVERGEFEDLNVVSVKLYPSERRHDSWMETLYQAIDGRTAKLGVIGLGYVGLPLIDAYVEAGFQAIGFDVDQAKADALNQGESYIAHIKPEAIQSWRSKSKFEATTDMHRLGEADVILICVPTPLSESRDPDLKYVKKTAEAIAGQLRPGQMIILESTTYPGTTKDILLPILSRSGLEVGKDFFLAYSPERKDPGNPDFTAGTIPKVVGGIEPNSLKLATRFYEKAITRVVPVKSCEVAEACKILENTYRSVNIAMVNELKVLFHKIGIDVWEVIDAAKTKPFGFQAFYPGPGLGGHCISIDPFYLSWVARKHEYPMKFIELAGEINTSMPVYIVHRVAEALNDVGKPIRGSRIGIFGIAYKKDVDDPRESPSFKLMELLLESGAELSYCDPHIPNLPKMRHFDIPALTSQDQTPEYLASLDCVLIATDHSIFDWDQIVQHAPLVVDTRNATKDVTKGREKIHKA